MEDRNQSTDVSVRRDASYTYRAYFMDSDRGSESASSTANVVHFSGRAPERGYRHTKSHCRTNMTPCVPRARGERTESAH